NKTSGTHREQNERRWLGNEQVPRSRARIALIERPINQSIEKHRRRAREYHAHNNQQKRAQGREAIRGHDQRTQRKRQRKDCVRKTNQPEKSRHRAARLLVQWVHCGKFLQKATKKTKIQFGLLTLYCLRFLLVVCPAGQSEIAVQQSL